MSQLGIVDLNEKEMHLAGRHLQRLYPDALLVTEAGDVRDPGRMGAVFVKHRPKGVFRATTDKQVPLMEIARGEAIKNNVPPTRNVARAADRIDVDRFVCVSTDKAVRPTGVMGTSKRLAEMMVRGWRARRAPVSARGASGTPSVRQGPLSRSSPRRSPAVQSW